MSMVKPSCGFWDTTNYSYGEKFCRAGKEGIELVSIGEAYSRYADGSVKEYKCTTLDKRVLVVNKDYIIEEDL